MESDDENKDIRHPDEAYSDQLVEPINLHDALYNNSDEPISDDPY